MAILAVELMIPVFRSFPGPGLTLEQAAETLSLPDNTRVVAEALFYNISSSL